LLGFCLRRGMLNAERWCVFQLFAWYGLFDRHIRLGSLNTHRRLPLNFFRLWVLSRISPKRILCYRFLMCSWSKISHIEVNIIKYGLWKITTKLVKLE
jgi:hypothetical protein